MNVEELIERTKNYGIEKDADGMVTHIAMKLDFRGSVNNAIVVGEPCKNCGERLEWQDTWGIKEACRLYYEGREAWLRGDLETVADLFGVLV